MKEKFSRYSLSFLLEYIGEAQWRGSLGPSVSHRIGVRKGMNGRSLLPATERKGDLKIVKMVELWVFCLKST